MTEQTFPCGRGTCAHPSSTETGEDAHALLEPHPCTVEGCGCQEYVLPPGMSWEAFEGGGGGFGGGGASGGWIQGGGGAA